MVGGGAGTLLVVVLIVAFVRDSPSFHLARGRGEAAHAAAGKVIEGPIELQAERHN